MNEAKSYDNETERGLGATDESGNQPSAPTEVDKREQARAYQRAWRAKHPNYNKDWRARNSEQVKEYYRTYNRRRKRPKSYEEYMEQRNEQAKLTYYRNRQCNSMTLPQNIHDNYYLVALTEAEQPDFYERVRLNVLRGISTHTLSVEDNNRWWNMFTEKVRLKYAESVDRMHSGHGQSLF